MIKNWKQVNFKEILTFSLPTELTETDTQAIDSDIASWVGKDMTVRIDFGLFCDPLTSYTERPNYRLSNEEVGGRTARIIRFDLEGKKHFVAAHFHNLTEGRGALQKKLTIVIETSQKIGSDIAEKIIRSIKFQGE